METLKNEQLQITVSPMGAELQSIKDQAGREYLWQADAKYWGRHSPILFPIVCGLWNDTYRIDGYEYKLPRHGFARDMEFTLINKTENKVTYALHDSPETRRVYPYRFMLSITYRLEGNKIHVIWHVHNTDKNEIHFQIGGHPAFYIPDMQEGDEVEGTIQFDNEGAVERLIGNDHGCIIPGRFPVDTHQGIWKFTEKDFAEDCVIMDKSQLKRISLLDKQQRPVVTVETKAPCTGVWAPYGKKAPFVCIEPWYGIHDQSNYTGDFRKKYLMNHLQPGASFMAEYTIEIQ